MTGFQIERSALLDGVPHGFFGSADGAHQFGFGGPGDPAEVQFSPGVGTRVVDWENRRIEVTSTAYRSVIGLRGKLGREWEWEETPEVSLMIVDDLDQAIDRLMKVAIAFAQP